MAGPGFLRREAANSPGRVPTYDFAKFPQKWHEICPNYPESPFLEFKTRITPQMENFTFHISNAYSWISPSIRLQSRRWNMENNLYPPWIPVVWSLLRTLNTVLKGLLAMASDYQNTSWARSKICPCFGSRSAVTDHHRKVEECLLRFSTCPSICWKDSALVAATFHHPKV